MGRNHRSLHLLRGDVDVAIRGGPDRVPGFTATEFLREGRLPVCSPALFTRHPLQRPEDLSHHTLLHSAALPDVWPEWLRAAGVAHARPLLPDTAGCRRRTRVAIGPAALIADDVAEGRLMTPFKGPALSEWRYFAYVREDEPQEAAQAFRDWLVAAGRETATIPHASSPMT